jgi:hypothetical protein
MSLLGRRGVPLLGCVALCLCSSISSAALSAEARAQEAVPESDDSAAAAERAVEFREQTYLVPVNLPLGRVAQLHARL